MKHLDSSKIHLNLTKELVKARHRLDAQFESYETLILEKYSFWQNYPIPV